MKALGVATALVTGLFLGIFVWALAGGSSMSGEPTALLQIKVTKTQQKLSMPANAPGKRENKLQVSGAQVVLDITPPDIKEGGASVPKARLSGIGRPGSGGLTEHSKYGPLPKRARDGRSPARSYARAKRRYFDTLPRIAILVKGLGLNQGLSTRAIGALPSEITLAFSAYGRKLGDLTNKARVQGHELMLEVPLEPLDYPTTDTGPKTLLVSRGMQDNRPLLHWALGRFTGYFGVVNSKGGRYLADKNAASGLFQELQSRGLYFFRDQAVGNVALADLAAKTGIGYAQATLQIDRQPSREGLSLAFVKLEAIARRSGMAVGVAHMHPVSIDMIAGWSKTLKKRGLQLVPVSAAYQHTGGL